MLHIHKDTALQTSLFLKLVNLEETLMQGKNTSDIKLNLPTCQGLEKCLGLGLSTSWSRSRLGPKIERLGLGLDLVKSGKVSVSVSYRTGSQTSRSRLSLGPQRLVYIPA